jgi:hypothetical protein
MAKNKDRLAKYYPYIIALAVAYIGYVLYKAYTTSWYYYNIPIVEEPKMTIEEAESLLGLSGEDYTINDVKKAFRNKALRGHPDKNMSPEAQPGFIELAKAKELLLSTL